VSVRWTEPNAVALYDSVTGTAFGPIFDSSEDASKFLEMLDGEGVDARTLSPSDLDNYFSGWQETKD